jgi:hypothetical protein
VNIKYIFTPGSSYKLLPEELYAAVRMKGDKFGSRRKGGAILEDPGEEWAWLPRHQAADHAPRVVGEGEAGGKGTEQLWPVRIRAQHST